MRASDDDVLERSYDSRGLGHRHPVDGHHPGADRGAVYWLVSELSGRNPREAAAPGEGSAREILDRRLAKGELTVEQYKELRATLDGEATVVTDKPPLPSRPASAPG